MKAGTCICCGAVVTAIGLNFYCNHNNYCNRYNPYNESYVRSTTQIYNTESQKFAYNSIATSASGSNTLNVQDNSFGNDEVFINRLN